jgi:hypothetical protein
MHEERFQRLKEEEQTLRKEIEEEDRAAAEEEREAKESTAALAASAGRDWMEAKSPEGYSYYWNVKTNGEAVERVVTNSVSCPVVHHCP